MTGAVYNHGSFSHLAHLYLHASAQRASQLLPLLFRSTPHFFRWFGELLTEFSRHAEAALQQEPFDSTLLHFEKKWFNLGVSLHDNGFPTEAGEVFLRWYQFVREAEIAHAKRFPKGSVLWWLGTSRKSLRRDDESRNWFLLAMLEDIRSSDSWRTLPARDSLVKGLQVSADVVDGLGGEVETWCAERQWSPTEPESFWLALCPHKRRFTRAPVPFLKGLAAQMAAWLVAPGQTAKQKGNALEQLICYVFAAEPGFEVLGPSTAPDAQHDVLIRNAHSDAALAALGDYLIVECKNWHTKVRAPIVREMAGRLQAASVKTGVLVSREGISGVKPRNRRSGARLTISKEYVQDQTAILVLNKEHLDSMVAGKESLSSLLLEALEDVRFDRV